MPSEELLITATLIGMSLIVQVARLLIGHLEAAVAVDRPHGAVGLADLRAHRRGHRVAHGAGAAGVEPRVGALVLDELRRPHLVLADARGEDALGSGDLADALDHVLRREQAVDRLGVAERELLLEALEVGPPLGGVGAAAVDRLRERVGEVGQDVLEVAHDRHIGRADLGDLGGVDVDVHDLGLGREQRRLAGHAVVEAGAEREDQVGLLQREHRGNGAVHAGHAQVLLVRVGERAAGHQRGDHRGARRLGERLQLGRRAGADDTAADVEHRLLRLGQQLRRGLDLLAVRLGDGAVAGQVDLRRPEERGLVLLRVLGDVDEHGAGAAGRRDQGGGGEGLRMSSGRVTRMECLVIGIVMPTMSASWNASVPISVENT